MNEEIQEELNQNPRAQLLNQGPIQDQNDYGALNDNHQDEARSQMGESVRYGDLMNQAQIERVVAMQKSFRTKIVAISVFMLALLVVTLLTNKVGVHVPDLEEDNLCEIGLSMWYIQYTVIVALKLLITLSRYYLFKRNRQENIPVFLLDLIVMNTLMTGIFIKANIMYFDEKNMCWYTNDSLTKSMYGIFCGLTLLGYMQFIWCIFLSCSIPLSAFLIYQLVEHRVNMRNQQNGNMFSEGLIGGLMQVPLPIPEILSQLSRTKFQSSQFGIQSQCAICWMDFKDNEEVTPLICDERHLYHTKCIEAWIRKGHNTCPLCRKQIANLNGL